MRKTAEKETIVSYAEVVAGNVVDDKVTDTNEDDIIEVLEESFDQTTNTGESDELQLAAGPLHGEKFKKKKEPTLEEIGYAIQEALGISQAKQRRAQYAASGSGSSSGSGTVPRKKCARRTFY